MSAVVEVSGLHVSYERDAPAPREVLRGLDLAVDSGELLALLGPNGSGKTTLLRAIAGTVPRDAGKVVLFGRSLEGWSRVALARRVAVLPQSLVLPDGFRVAELVEMGRAPHASRWFGPSAADAEAVERALTDADALDLAERHADELSGGERQRALVAMALAQEPELLLLDEPTLHLDIAHQATLLATVARLRARRGLTVIAVLHDLNLAAAHAPRIALLGDGRIVADGEPAVILRPDLVRDVFGVSVDEALTADGRRFLVPHAGAPELRNEPSRRSGGIYG
ncbi:MAG: ABC transporter ATP-binding protein [Chloroflexota bacterium]|nr:ABC transporter ATP-binding protein [Chloroflexota bacterium]